MREKAPRMADGSVMSAGEPARLLLIGSGLADRLATPIAAGFAVAPIVIELAVGRQAVDVLRGSRFDVVAAELAVLGDLADVADERIGRLARAASGALLLAIADDGSVSAAMGAMRAGAHDCICRDASPDALVERIGELARRHGRAIGMAMRASAEAEAVQPAAVLPTIPSMRDLVLPMWRQEQRIIEDAIQSFAGNIALAAAALELSPSTIYRKRQAWAEMGEKRGVA